MELECHIRVHYNPVPVFALSWLKRLFYDTFSYYPPSYPCFPNKTAYTFLASPNRATFQICFILSAPQVMKRLQNVNCIQSLAIPRCQESFLPPTHRLLNTCKVIIFHDNKTSYSSANILEYRPFIV